MVMRGDEVGVDRVAATIVRDNGRDGCSDGAAARGAAAGGATGRVAGLTKSDMTRRRGGATG